MAPSCSSTLPHQPMSSGLYFRNSWNRRSGVGIPHSMQGEERGTNEEEQQSRGSNLPSSSSSSEGTWDFGRPVLQSSFSFSLDLAPRSANQESTEKEPQSYSKSSKDSLIAIIDKALNILEGGDDDSTTSDGEDGDENNFGAYHLDNFQSS